MRTFVLPMLAILGAALVNPAWATTGRMHSLGGQADFFEDDANVRRWYGSLVDYPQRAMLELGQLDHAASGPLTSRLRHQGGGLHVQFDDAGAWGVGAVYFGDDVPQPDGGGWINVLAARRLGRLCMGGSFFASSFSDASSTFDPALLDGRSSFVHELGLGLRWDLSDGLYIDIAAHGKHIEVDYFRPDHGIAVENADSWDSFGARCRLFHGLNDRLVAIYRLDWSRDLRPMVDPALDDLADCDARSFSGGVGLNYLPDPDNLLVVSADYRSIQDMRRARHPFFAALSHNERDWWRLDVRCGLESRVLPWLTLRAAASYGRIFDEHTLGHADHPSLRRYSYRIGVQAPVVLGLGLHAGAFDADLVLNGAAPGGPGVPSDGDHRFTSLTLGYRF